MGGSAADRAGGSTAAGDLCHHTNVGNGAGDSGGGAAAACYIADLRGGGVAET